MAGTLYGVSVGPGDPQLMTLRAAALIAQCPVLAAPDGSTALTIAKGATDISGKRHILLEVPMTTDEQVLRAAHDRIADTLCTELAAQDVAFLCLGDVSLYASFSHIAQRVAERGFAVELCPGVPSFCAAAARAGKPLVSGIQPLQVLPWGCSDLSERLMLPGAKVILKCGRHLPVLREVLRERGLLERAYAVENCGMDGERFWPALDKMPERCGYFTIVCITP